MKQVLRKHDLLPNENWESENWNKKNKNLTKTKLRKQPTKISLRIISKGGN